MGSGIDFQDVKVQTTDAIGRSQIPLPDLPPTAVRVYCQGYPVVAPYNAQVALLQNTLPDRARIGSLRPLPRETGCWLISYASEV